MMHFFSCDWGTTSFRLRRVNAISGTVVEEVCNASGVKMLDAGCPVGEAAAREKVFASFLRDQLRCIAGGDMASLNGVSVIISGMASSSVGWRELPYARLPVGLDGSSIRQATFDLEVDHHSQAHIRLVSGVRAEADVMRGEETEILGLFEGSRYARIADSGIVVLPGTHSKHVRLCSRQITHFQTFMTGELFDVLSNHSLLRASVQAGYDTASEGLSESASRDAFLAGVRAARNEGLARSLFQTRARTVLHAISPTVNRWFLSGLLIGSELEALAYSELNVPILLAATESLSGAYGLAFEAIGLAERLSIVPPEEVALASVRGHRVLLRAEPKPESSPV